MAMATQHGSRDRHPEPSRSEGRTADTARLGLDRRLPARIASRRLADRRAGGICRVAYRGPSREQVLGLRRQYVNPAVFTLYREPLMIVEGKMQYLFDETGRRYLDLFAGIVTVSCGHCHPKVLRRVQDQVSTLQHATTIYLHPNLPLLAQKLASKMPTGLEVTYFVNSGSEANDLATPHDTRSVRQPHPGCRCTVAPW